MSGYYHSFEKFMHQPGKGETLREFIEEDCWQRAREIQVMIENLPEGKHYLASMDYELVRAMPVNFCVYTSNYSVKKHGLNAPPIVAERFGMKVAADDEYSFYGTLGDFLIHISAPCYGWIGELEYGSWEILEPDLIAYDHYDYEGGDLDDEEEDE